jgi:hypothetical protein
MMILDLVGGRVKNVKGDVGTLSSAGHDLLSFYDHDTSVQHEFCSQITWKMSKKNYA